MQYFLEFEPPIAGVFFESSAFSRASEQLEAIAERLGLASHFELFSYADQDDLCPPEYRETEMPWFDAEVGIDWLDAVSRQIRTDPGAVPNADQLLADFAECREAFLAAKTAGSKWHLAMDI